MDKVWTEEELIKQLRLLIKYAKLANELGDVKFYESILNYIDLKSKNSKRLDWFIETIVEYKPANYDGCPYGRYDILWENKESDLRKAIDNEMSKECKI